MLGWVGAGGGDAVGGVAWYGYISEAIEAKVLDPPTEAPAEARLDGFSILEILHREKGCEILPRKVFSKALRERLCGRFRRRRQRRFHLIVALCGGPAKALCER